MEPLGPKSFTVLVHSPRISSFLLVVWCTSCSVTIVIPVPPGPLSDCPNDYNPYRAIPTNALISTMGGRNDSGRGGGSRCSDSGDNYGGGGSSFLRRAHNL